MKRRWGLGEVGVHELHGTRSLPDRDERGLPSFGRTATVGHERGRAQLLCRVPGRTMTLRML